MGAVLVEEVVELDRETNNNSQVFLILFIEARSGQVHHQSLSSLYVMFGLVS